MANAEIEVVRAQLAASPRPASLAERRARLDALGGRYAVPADVAIETVSANGVQAEWTLAAGSDPSRVAIFLHGGGYISGSIASHRHMVAQLGKQAGMRTLAVGYRLAPEHPFPAALHDALAAYRFVLAQGTKPQHIALAGESAGGGLALATMISLRDAGEPLPACAWLSSPWADLQQTGPCMQSKADIDPLIQKPYLDDLARQYLGGVDGDNPLASPIHADLHGLPPLLVYVGSAETLLDDATRLAALAGAADVRVTLDIWPDMIHAFTLFYPQLEVARQALVKAGAFLRAELAR